MFKGKYFERVGTTVDATFTRRAVRSQRSSSANHVRSSWSRCSSSVTGGAEAELFTCSPLRKTT